MLRSRCLIASAALAAGPTLGLAQTITDTTIPLTSHASGFGLPTGVEFLGRNPNDFFVIEKDTGQVKRYLNGTTSVVLDLAVSNESERGLLGMAKDPNFASNGYVYLYYSKAAADGGTWVQNQLSRFTWDGTSLGLEATLKVFSTASEGQATGPNHDAGPLVFGPDGKIYGTTGDLNRDRAEQNNQAQAGNSAGVGGIYRLNSDGSVPSDNPIASTGSPFHQWYAYGVRNTFGINVDPLTGAIWDTENGPNVYDEINRIDPGTNSGWNEIMGPVARDTEGTGTLVTLPGGQYSDPEFSFLTPVAVTGIDFLANTTIDANYRDAVVVGDNNLGNLYLYRLNANRDAFTSLPAGLEDLVADSATERNLVRFGQSFSAVTELQTGPDGGVYVTSIGSGTIWRIGLKSWKVDADGTWINESNWAGTTPGGPDDSPTDYAAFFGTISAPRTVTTSGSLFMKGVIFNSPIRYTISPISIFSLTNTGDTAYLRVLGGSHTIAGQTQIGSAATLDIVDTNSVMTISGPLVMNDNFTATKTGPGTVEVQSYLRAGSFITAGLTISAGTFKIIPNGGNSGTSNFANLTINGGRLDLTNNRMVLTGESVGAWNGSNYDGVTGLIKSGRTIAGSWSGDGIVTSMTAAQPGMGVTTLGVATASQVLGIGLSATAIWSGQTVTGDDVLVKYAYAGDANLSGFVDADDYFQIDSNYGTTVNSEKSWFNGDFDYDGDFDSDDYVVIDAGFSGQGGPLVPGSAFAAAAAVPESSPIALVAASIMASRRRRR